MHHSSRFPFILAVAVAIAALAASPAIGGSVKRFDSTVTLSANNPFHGHVSSSKHACEVQRTVKVFNKKAGPDGLFGKTTTDGDGKWSMDGSGVNGNFYAKVTRREEGAAGTTYVCRPDVSPIRHFSGGGY